MPVHGLGARGNGDVAWMVRLRRLLVSGDYDIVHFHLPYAAALGRLVTLSLPRHRRPVTVYTEHSMWAKTPLAVRMLNRLTIGRDAALMAVSTAARDALPPSLRGRARVVVHGIDQSRAAAVRADRQQVRIEVRRELGVTDGEVLVLSVANLRTEKGYDVLLEAARRVIDSGAPARFAAAGWGPLADQVEAERRSLGLGDRFQLLGHRGDALRLMGGADVFVLASHHEGLPVTVMEATSLGLAMVTTAVGDMPNFLTDGVDALLVPPGRPDALAHAIERVVGDAELRCRLARGALAHGATFDIARATREIESVYRDLPGAGG
jgi:glycosyltransferase involved in cell wall biosynthesis